MEKAKTFNRARFSADTLNDSIELFCKETGVKQRLSGMSIRVNGETWEHDDLSEFFADYRRSQVEDFALDIIENPYRLRVVEMSGGTRVLVKAPTRAKIETIFSFFEKHFKNSVVPLPPEPPEPPEPPPTIFIGHGRNPAWRDLKDHLHEKHGYEIVAYETGARAGHTIRDVLDKMADESTLAFLGSL